MNEAAQLSVGPFLLTVNSIDIDMDSGRGDVPFWRRSNLMLTFAIYVCIFAFGLGFSMISPARNNIAQVIGSNFGDVSYGTSARTAGYAIGALFFGWLYSKFNRQVGLSACLALAAGSMMTVPFVRILALYMVSEVAYGLFIGGVDVACNSWILEIWQGDANPYMQGLQFCFALGLAIGPLIEEPFLSQHPHNDTSYSISNNAANNVTHEQGSILVPYSIGSLTMLSAACLMLILFLRKPYTQQNRSLASPKHSVTSE